ncbi:hypothetical protein Dimus_022552 [Dionaea muscipula]
MVAVGKTPLKRKPLVDRTNTIATAAAAGRCSLLKSAAESKPLKPSNITKIRPSSSLKSDTSIGSNNPPIGVPSKPPPPTATALPASFFKSGSISCKSAAPTVQDERQSVQTRKDKGKTVLGNPPFDPSKHLAVRNLRVPLSAAFEPSAANQPEAAPTSKDKGKAVSENPFIDPLYLPTHENLHVASSSASGGSACKRSTLPFTPDETLVVETRKDKQKAISRDFVERIHLPPPDGTDDPEKIEFRTVCNQRRRPRTRSTTSLSCPNGKRSRDQRVKLDNGGRESLHGSFSDALPVHEKQPPAKDIDDHTIHAMPQDKDIDDHTVHAMPQDEIEKLRAYYAAVDAFELPVEVASDSDLE